ncbi:WYL domain-containing protein [Candidatus Nomurabacteria bacterium]|nr:WYL domain-containing protein [Candidatus Nomurabacteria bacterium]
MKSQLPKKMLVMNILEILKLYSDVDHTLSQKDILDFLRTKYDMVVDRKAVKRNLMNLIEFGYDIEYSETIRKNKKGEDELVCSGWYLRHDFEDSELRLLIDSLLFSKHIPYNQCKDLIEKLKGLSGSFFSVRVKHIRNLPEKFPENKDLFLTIEVLDEAISKEHQVSFHYNNYDIDKRLHPRKNENGIVREYIVNPYQMVATNGRYYLVCNYDKYDNVANYRIDRISDITLLDSRVKDRKLVKGIEKGLDLPKHMAEHIYMFAGDSINVKFRAKRYIVTEIIDWFGFDAVFTNENYDEVDVTVKVNENAMLCWALQYSPHIEILEPKKLRDEVCKAIKEMSGKYEIGG